MQFTPQTASALSQNQDFSGFTQNTNPRILQRQARHRNIETTLRYDHTSDKMVRDHFNRIQLQNVENLTSNDKARALLDELLSKEIDLKTFKTGIDVLLPHKRNEDDIGYI